MNKMILNAQVLTIRDRQLQENKELEREYLDQQKRLDQMMEIERLKDYQSQIHRDAVRKEARYKAGKILIDQIKEREIERQNRMQSYELEKVQMRKNIEQAII